MTNSNEIDIKLAKKKEGYFDYLPGHPLITPMDLIKDNPMVRGYLQEKKKSLSTEALAEDIRYGTLHTIDRIDQLEQTLNAYIKRVEQKMKELNEKIAPNKTIVLREISKSDAKKEVLNFVKVSKDKRIFPSDIADKLDISYDIILEIVQELIEEKKIEVTE